MSRFQDGQKAKKIMHSPGMLFVYAILCIILTVSTVHMYEKSVETSKNKALAQLELDRLIGQEDSLEKDIAKLETEEGIEENVREKYRVAKEGEHLIVITDPRTQTASVAETEQVQTGIWQKIKAILSKFF